MSHKQLTLVSIILGLAILAVVLEAADNHVTTNDLIGIASFFAGASAVIWIMKLGGKDGDD